ncbi:MAG: hypothetical protein FJX66_03700 [Alphaproteobacteria bacterium]|nr:hypothetical protein [Alphaproteobacteria bacterium]
MIKTVGFRSAVAGIAMAALCLGTVSEAVAGAAALAQKPGVERALVAAEAPVLKAASRTNFGKDWTHDPHDRRGPHDEHESDGRYGRDNGDYDYGRDDDGYDYDYGGYDDGGDVDDGRHDRGDRGRHDDRCWSRDCDGNRDRDYDYDRPSDHHDEASDNSGLDQGGLKAVLIGGAIAAVLLGGVLGDD